MGFLSWLFKRKHQPSEEAFQGVLKFNTVFVTDESLEKLTVRGFGARRLRQVLYSAPYSPNQAEAPAEDRADEGAEEAGESKLAAVPSPAIASRRVDTDNDKSPMILFDEEAFFLFRLGILELQHEDGIRLQQRLAGAGHEDRLQPREEAKEHVDQQREQPGPHDGAFSSCRSKPPHVPACVK